MKFRNTLCSQQRNSADFEEFLLSNYETIESNPHIERNNERNTSENTGKGVTHTPNRVRSSRRVRPEPKHISRSLHYIDENKESGAKQHRSVLEAPFVRMKEIHISPPRHPIREDPKKFRYFSNCISIDL